jgi:hypothetical protein
MRSKGIEDMGRRSKINYYNNEKKIINQRNRYSLMCPIFLFCFPMLVFAFRLSILPEKNTQLGYRCGKNNF